MLKAVLNSCKVSSSDEGAVAGKEVSNGSNEKGSDKGKGGSGVGGGVGIGVGSGVDGWHARGGFVWWLWVCGGGGGWQHVVVG